MPTPLIILIKPASNFMDTNIFRGITMHGQLSKKVLAIAYFKSSGCRTPKYAGCRTLQCAICAAMLLAFLTIGCSGGDAVSPVVDDQNIVPARTDAAHQLWGIYDISIDLKTGTIDIIPLRQTQLRLNAVPALEPPPLANLNVANVVIIPPSPLEDGRILCDVLLTNPYAGLSIFTGFDVKGIVFGPMLDNADGTTRWWNPVEFTGSGIFGFKPGMLGHQDISAFTEIFNDYKYFSLGLNTDDVLSEEPVIGTVIDNRGHFPVGETLSRHYEINFGPDAADFFIFQYAVDASWAPPSGSPPYEPDDFPPDANQPEAWVITTAEIENTLNYFNGEGTGELTLHVAVYDWQDCDDTQVAMVCDEPGVFIPQISLAPITVYPNYAIYEFIVTDAVPTHAGELPIMISALSSDIVYGEGNPWGTYPDAHVTAFWHTEVTVTNDPTGQTDCEGTLHANVEGGNAWTTDLALDANGTSPMWDMAFQQHGPYAGYVIYPYKDSSVSDGKVTALHYFDADAPIDNPTSGVFYQFPNEDNCDWVWSVDCGATEGRVAYVGSNNPDTFIALDNEGTKLSEVIVGSNTIAIQAMCFDDFDQLWVLSLHTTMFEPNWRLRYFAQVDGPPYYVEALVVDLSPYYPFSLLSFIYDMDYNFQSERLYIFDMDGGTFESNMGSIHVFDIGPGGIPVHNQELSLETVFPTAVDLLPEGQDGRHHWQWHVAWGGDIFIDHSSGDNERCRITCMAVLEDDTTDSVTDTFWMLFDEDLVMFDSFHEPFSIEQGGKCWDTFAVNPDTNRNIAAMWRNNTWEYVPKPADW